MTTAIYVAERALKLLLVQAADAPLEADEYQDFYNAMNDFMADLEARGVSLGYTAVSGPADKITIPSGAIRGLVANMALEVAPDYEAAVTPQLERQAMEGYRTLRRLGRNKVSTSLHPNLPIGSGNYQHTYTDSSSYGEIAKALLTLVNNTTATVIAAVDTPTKIAGFWEEVDAEGLRADINGRITNTSDDAFTLELVATVEVTGGTDYTLHVYENGNESVASAAGTANGTELVLRKTIILLPNEHIELWIENDVDAADLTVRDARLQVQ